MNEQIPTMLSQETTGSPQNEQMPSTLPQEPSLSPQKEQEHEQPTFSPRIGINDRTIATKQPIQPRRNPERESESIQLYLSLIVEMIKMLTLLSIC